MSIEFVESKSDLEASTYHKWLTIIISINFQNLEKYDVKDEIYRDNAICSYLLYGNDMCTQNTTTYVLGRFICKKDNTNVCNYYSSPVRIIAAFNVSLASIFLFCSQINHTQKLHLMITHISFSELKTQKYYDTPKDIIKSQQVRLI